ncbi:hypothetical protein LOTGIDRAFT_228559 [Lottia gigantea]|uniref:CS domain-containing protein n=1 Tax=Lottia gigantea TaxID=225164 RepID=V3ZQT4_LOTGI|nr:hypothetical protein LOTGIDRAFT_228559 [Lottia gigantea]ESO93783.1 hypothetical protein LOTGIDRAFT_228559 [Lottia gigantea]
MADFEVPVVTSEDIDLTTARVALVVTGLQITKGIFKKAKPKNGTVDVVFGERSFEVTAEIKGKNGVPKIYKQTIKKLPGLIDKDACTVDYKKDQVILTLKKEEEGSWAVQLSQSGLEQSDD